jgi:hypothetical protein
MGRHRPIPTEPGVRISRAGLPRTDQSCGGGGLHPCLCESGTKELEPRFGVEGRPVAGTPCFLAATTERPAPLSSHTVVDASKLRLAQAESEVLVVALERPR